jgi:hypothetical protein
MVDYGDRIFENYELFLKEHRDDLGTPAGAIEMLSSDGSFRAYIDALTEGLDAQTKRSIFAIAEREREMLLEESINVGPSAAVVGYAVSYFPILTDIYSDPILSQIATTYPVNKPVITIPKVSIQSSVKNSDGTTSTYRLPTSSSLVRTTDEEIDLLPGKVNNVFAMSNGGSSLVTADTAFLNKRYFVITEIKYTDADSAPQVIDVMIRPDSRGQINHTVRFVETSNNIELTVIGNVNWDNGNIQFNTTLTNLTDADPVVSEVDSLTAKVVFSARTGDIGRVRVDLKMSGWDINIDVRDSFEIKLDQEVIQDYSDIYEIDMIRTLSMAIKNQMLYNKDYDLAYYLGIYEPEYKALGSYSTFDMDNYVASGTHFTPSNVLDVFKGVIPCITTVNRNIRKVFRAEPQFLVAGTHTASLLESLQAFMVGFQDTKNGEAGFSSQNSAIDFRKQRILACDPIPNDRIYAIYRAPNDDLTRTAIVDLIYKPLYMIEEIDNSQRRTFVKSRTAIELTAPEAIGCIEMKNYSQWLGTAG